MRGAGLAAGTLLPSRGASTVRQRHRGREGDVRADTDDTAPRFAHTVVRPKDRDPFTDYAMISFLSRASLAVTLLVAPLHAQSPASLELIGPGGATRTVTAAAVAAMPRHEVSARAHMVSGRFSGVLLPDLLRLVGMPRSDSLRGPALATYVLIEAADGYRALFAVAELDAGFTDRVVLLADRKDGAALSAKDGPFQLIVPDEKRPARWVRQVRRIRVVQLPPPGA